MCNTSKRSLGISAPGRSLQLRSGAFTFVLVFGGVGAAVIAGDWAIEQLWLFILAPLAGGILAAVVHRFLFSGMPPVDLEESAVAAQ